MIYLDHAATSPMTREVLEAMWPYLTSSFGNASSRHEPGLEASKVLERARAQVALAFGCSANEIIFTSGGTESNNLAIKGVALAMPRGRHLVTSAIEHEAVIEPMRYLERFHGFRISVISVDQYGVLNLDELAEAITPETTLCSIQYANSEVGTVQDLDAIKTICGDVPLHVDAVQAAGILPIGIGDLISISAHKFGGPKGIGVLYRRHDLELEPVMHGGGQEGGLRSGTSNVAGAIGLSVALEAADEDRAAFSDRMKTLRDQLIAGVLAIPNTRLTGSLTHRLPHHASFTTGVSGDALVSELALHDIAISSGSACAEGHDEPSTVLLAMGIADAEAQTAIRFTLGAETTADEIASVVKELTVAIEDLC